ncbi:MAG: transporter substrate-binding domain-containing protein [Ruminococcaceae bacterium]|nr:transporter substrate-binding domain-containing protein [Oscillospiraceae bacterium]
MINCSKCKKPIPDNATKCPYCGNKAAKPAGKPRKKKKGVAIVAVILVLAIAAGAFYLIKKRPDIIPGFGADETTTATEKLSRDNEVQQIKEAGKIVVGVTELMPMNYRDGDKWIGFDSDLAKEFAEYLGVEVEFKEINWNEKRKLLDDRAIDCIWNGMETGQNGIDCSDAYISSNLVVVMSKSMVDSYASIEDCNNLTFAVERNSAAADIAETYGLNYTLVADTEEALSSIKKGFADAAIIDSIIVGSLIGDGTEYNNITVAIELEDGEEQWAVGFRKGSDLTAEFNKFYDEKVADGTIERLARKYGLEYAIIK